MEQRYFGTTKQCQEAQLFTIRNSNGMKISVTDYGSRLVSVHIPDKYGKIRDIVLGYDCVSQYEKDPYCFGANIGRNANRIKNAEFVLNGKKYCLSKNEYNNNSHSGPNGYQFRMWNIEEIDESSIRFLLVSPDLDQGFPGEFTVSVTYTLTEENEIVIQYTGISTSDTVVNMTHHSYFNLGGHDSGNVLNQYLRIQSALYSPVSDYQCIPIGKYTEVQGTPMNFLNFKKIGREIEADFVQLNIAGDYNHNFILDKDRNAMGLMAEAYCEESGIYMKAETNLPAMQLYTGAFIDSAEGKNRCIYEKRSGFCLEAQYTPNAINSQVGEKPILKAGERYDKTIRYQFSCRNVIP